MFRGSNSPPISVGPADPAYAACCVPGIAKSGLLGNWVTGPATSISGVTETVDVGEVVSNPFCFSYSLAIKYSLVLNVSGAVFFRLTSVSLTGSMLG